MTDFRNLQHYVAQIRASPEPEEYYLEGFAVLRHCAAEAQAVLSAPFSATPSPDGDPEQEMAQLRSVILDASIRRFRCQKVYLRATAAMRWVNSRQSVLRGQKPHAGHMPALQAVDNSLRAVSFSQVPSFITEVHASLLTTSLLTRVTGACRNYRRAR